MRIDGIIERHISHKLAYKIRDAYWQHYLLNYTIKSGIDFINSYDEIYTTRLHVAIIGVLLNKKVHIFDNSYGKNSALYNTWLKDLPSIELL